MKTPARVLISLFVAALLVAVLMRWGGVSVEGLARAWREVSWTAVALAFAIYALQYALRAERFRVLVPPASRPGFGCALSVTAAYGMATLILPAKTGEAAYVVYMNRAGGVSTPAALASLVIARLLDLASLFLGFGAACIGLAVAEVEPRLPWFAPLGAFLVASSAAVFALSARGDLLVRFAAQISHASGVTRIRLVHGLVERIEALGQALREAGRDGRVWRSALLSLPMWACVFAFCAVLGRGFGLPDSVGFASACFGASLAILTSLVPVSAFANFGTLEAGWVLGFGIFGIGGEQALATGTGLHLVQLAFAVFLGVLGHVGMGLAGRR